VWGSPSSKQKNPSIKKMAPNGGASPQELVRVAEISSSIKGIGTGLKNEKALEADLGECLLKVAVFRGRVKAALQTKKHT